MPPKSRPQSASELHDAAEAIADAALPVHPEARHHDSLEQALVAALSELTVIVADREAEIEMRGGGSYSYKFASIADLVKRTRPVLARHGLVALTPVHEHGGGLACSPEIVWEGGETKTFPPFSFPHGHDAQATGSMVTYHRRYALIAALGMAAGDEDEDDDGAGAVARATPVVWTLAMGKRHLLNLVGGDTKLAGEVWKWGTADTWPAWDQQTVEGLLQRYQTAHPQEAPTPATEAAPASEEPGSTEDAADQQEPIQDPLQAIIGEVEALSPAEVEGALLDAGLGDLNLGTDAERRRALATHRAEAAGLEL